MAGAINVALNWRWTFRTLGIVGMALIPLAVVALWEPKAIRARRLERRKGKRTYPIKVVMQIHGHSLTIQYSVLSQ